ncbi:MAG: hypothetical protein LQ346_005997 [Caloplaca aetnensis]|nr:MAG: hypothetical protein LQ346_005997 [Caloplaca aetnensis]
MSLYEVSKLKLDNGIEVFYRHAGPANAPILLLLHGFPSSSHQFRNLIPLLSTHYRVIALDLPGYGFTTIPEDLAYTYTFANLTDTIDAFLTSLAIKQFAMYIFDYGAPVGLRLALKHPKAVTAIITQNGNAYEEGFGAEFWAPVRSYWASHAPAEREELKKNVLTLETTTWQYEFGNPHPERIQPETYYLDQALIERPGNKEVQLDLLYDYRTNVPLYPEFQKWIRESGVPVLAMWGKNDIIFVPAGAEAFRRDVEESRLEIRFVDAGHFALETNEKVYAAAIGDFLGKFLPKA